MGSVWDANQTKPTVKCEICGLTEIDLGRYNDHFKSKHDKNFLPLGRKVLNLMFLIYKHVC